MEDKNGIDLRNRLEEMVGEQHVVFSREDIEIRARVTLHRKVPPRAFVYPGSVEEVQAIVKLANDRKIPLWICSRGNNWGYGASTPFQPDSIVLVMERMNSVLEVNETLAYAVIEPGVSYRQLNDYLKSNHHDLWIDCIDGSPEGSVLGNALERGIGETPYGDHFGNLCGLEVVLPNGEIIDTGAGEDGRLRTWHVHKWGTGPYLEGLFSQSNLGIVTRAGIWLMPKPEMFNSYVFEVKDEGRTGEVIDAFRELALQGVVTTKLHMINDIVSFTVLTQKRNEKLEGKQLTEQDIDRLRKKYGVSVWSCAGGVYGDKALVKVQKSIMKRRLKGLGRLTFVSDQTLQVLITVMRVCQRYRFLGRAFQKVTGTSLEALSSAPYIHEILKGVPTEYFVNHAYFRHKMQRPTEDVHPAKDRCGLTWFAPILPFESKEMLDYLGQCQRLFEERGFDFYVAILMMNPRAAVCLMAIIFDKEEREQIEQADVLYEALLSHMYSNNYQQYRAGVASWEHIFDQARGFLSLNNTIKSALDPNNILAPGKYGIGKTGPYQGVLD